LALHNFILTALAVTPVLLFIFACFGLYNIRGARKMSVQGFKVFASVSLGLFLVMILFFFDQQLFPSRFIILAAWGYAIAFVFVGSSRTWAHKWEITGLSLQAKTKPVASILELMVG
jgi:FlaA1/EpsC-like NDP-sugar epimerase